MLKRLIAFVRTPARMALFTLWIVISWVAAQTIGSFVADLAAEKLRAITGYTESDLMKVVSGYAVTYASGQGPVGPRAVRDGSPNKKVSPETAFKAGQIVYTPLIDLTKRQRGLRRALSHRAPDQAAR